MAETQEPRSGTIRNWPSHGLERVPLTVVTAQSTNPTGTVHGEPGANLFSYSLNGAKELSRMRDRQPLTRSGQGTDEVEVMVTLQDDAEPPTTANFMRSSDGSYRVSMMRGLVELDTDTGLSTNPDQPSELAVGSTAIAAYYSPDDSLHVMRENVSVKPLPKITVTYGGFPGRELVPEPNLLVTAPELEPK